MASFLIEVSKFPSKGFNNKMRKFFALMCDLPFEGLEESHYGTSWANPESIKVFINKTKTSIGLFHLTEKIQAEFTNIIP